MLGADVSNTETSMDKDTIVLSHLAKIRTMCAKKFAQVPIVFVPERGTGSTVSRCNEIVRNVPSVETIREGGGQLYGIYKSEPVSSGYIETWKSLTNNNRIKWHSEFFTLSTGFAEKKRIGLGGARNQTDEELVVMEWKTQMKRMQMIGRKITGKGKNNEWNDDLAIAGMQAAYWSQDVENLENVCYQYIRDLVWVPLSKDRRGSHKFGFDVESNPEMFRIMDDIKGWVEETLAEAGVNKNTSILRDREIMERDNRNRRKPSRGGETKNRSEKARRRRRRRRGRRREEL